MRTRHSMSHQLGFSMVELMVALVLGLILTSGVISVYLTSKKTYSLNNGLGAVQQSGRFVFNFMEFPIRMAGYTGCSHSGTLYNHLQGGGSTAIDLSKPVQGYDASGTAIGDSYTISASNIVGDSTATNWTPNLPSDITSVIPASGTGSIVPGNDIVVLHEATNGNFALVSPYQDSAGVFVTSASAAQLQDGEIAVICDAQKASLFQITNVSTSSGRVDHSQASYTPGNVDSNWPNNQVYGAGARLVFYSTFLFYIGQGIDGSPSLFEANLGITTGILAAPVEVVPGVENMQILYGVDTNSDKIPNNFQTADTVDSSGSWGSVVCVRIGIVTRSDDLSTDTTPTTAPSFVLLDPTAADGVTIVTQKDRRLRRTFQETISVRNLLP